MNETIVFWLAFTGVVLAVPGSIVGFLYLKDRWFRKPHVDKQPLSSQARSGSIYGDLAPPSSHIPNGEVMFDYSNHDGKYVIGKDLYTFETSWSKASNERIHCYNNPPSINCIAKSPRGCSIQDIEDASKLDFTSRSRTLEVGQIAVLKNVHYFYAALEILSIKDDTRGDNHDELSFRYWILTDCSANFSKI